MRIEQAVHGYEGGHMLLSSSVRLNSVDAHRMLSLSDSSGPGLTEREAGYITGYALRESGYYAIARTYPAPEVSRPGCVWTHTLLIPLREFTRSESLGSVLSYHRRPSRDELHRFSEPLVIPLLDASLMEKLPSNAGSIVTALYSGAVGIWAVAPYDAALDDLAIRLLEQLWPAGRAGFTFCTAALTPRQLDGLPFGLQFVPPRQERRWDSTVGTAAKATPDKPVPQWARLLVTDLEHRSRDLRAVLRTHGGVGSELSLVRDIARLYWSADRISAAKGLVDLVAGVSEPLAPDLQVAILGDPSTRWGVVSVTEREVLSAIVTSPSIARLDLETLAVASRLREERSASPAWALDTVRSISESQDTWAPGLVDALVGDLRPDELPTFAKRNSQAVVLRANLPLAEVADTWKLLPASLAVEFLRVASERVSDVRPIIAALLSAPSALRPDSVVEVDQRFLHAVLDEWNAGSDLSTEWMRAIAERPQEVRKWAAHCQTLVPEVAWLVLSRCVRRSSELPRFDAETWRGVAKCLQESPESSGAASVAHALWTAAGREGGEADWAVTSYRCLSSRKSDLQGSYSWSAFKDELPRPGLFESWSDGERLRRGVVRLFRRQSWPPEQFVRLTDDHWGASELLRLADKQISPAFAGQVRSLGAIRWRH